MSSPLTTARRTTRDLANKAADMAAGMTPAPKRVLSNQIRTLVRRGLAARAIGEGDIVPDFILPDVSGQPVRLNSLLERGPVVLVFYRGGWCDFCQTYLHGLQPKLFYLHELGAELVAVSPQLPTASLLTETTHELTFPMLSDVGLSVSHRFGLVYPLPPAIQRTYREFGIDLEAANGSYPTPCLPLAATLIITPDRRVHTASIDENPAQRLDPIDVLDALVQIRLTRS